MTALSKVELQAEIDSLKAQLHRSKVEPDEPKKLEVSHEDRINKALGGASDPVPQDYRDAVNELLNKDFSIHLKAELGVPAFKFTIIVPQKYTKEEIDLRPKVLSYADGLNGVRSWCELVLSSFGEGKNQIIADRTSGVTHT